MLTENVMLPPLSLYGKDHKANRKEFEDYFEVQILKAYKKPFTRLIEEGTFITSHKGELLNSKSEWHQAKVVRTRTEVIQGGAEVVQGRRERGPNGGGRVGGDQARGGREGGGQVGGGRVGGGQAGGGQAGGGRVGGGSDHTLGGRAGRRTQGQ